MESWLSKSRVLSIFFFFFFYIDVARSRRRVDTPNEFPDDVPLINCLRMVFLVTEVVMVVRHQWMGDLVFARDGEPVFKGDVTVFPSPLSKTRIVLLNPVATVVYLLLVASFFFFQCRTSLCCLVKEFGIHIREQNGTEFRYSRYANECIDNSGYRTNRELLYADFIRGTIIIYHVAKSWLVIRLYRFFNCYFSRCFQFSENNAI